MELNKFGISPEAGDGVYAPQPARTFKIASAVSTPFGPTTVLKLAGQASNGLPVVTPITSTSDTPYCVAATSLRGNSFSANDKIKAWVSDEVVWMKASAAITQGALVSAAVDGTVATANGGIVLGIAESSAAAANDLVAVRITAPYAVIGGYTQDLSGYLTSATAASTYLSQSDAATNYQAKLTAGDFVAIDAGTNTITTTYTAGTGVTISDSGEISAG